MHIEELDTPVAVVDLDRLEANIARLQIYIADSVNNRVRRLRPGGALETVAGGEGGPRLNGPHGLRLYGEGVLPVSDHFANRVLAMGVPAAGERIRSAAPS